MFRPRWRGSYPERSENSLFVSVRCRSVSPGIERHFCKISAYRDLEIYSGARLGTGVERDSRREVDKFIRYFLRPGIILMA